MPPPAKPNSPRTAASPSSTPKPAWLRWTIRLTLWLLGLATAGALSLALVIAVALAMAYPNLPDISDLADYRPKLPLRVYSAEGALLGEFGEERRNLTPIGEIPKVMKDAVLAIEDTRFFQHGGVDYKGMLRAGLANLGKMKSQGASTITMQVARNVYLSSEKTFTRKIYEILLTFKLARVRQLHIIDRMEENHFITPEEAEVARKEELKIRTGADSTRIHAEYVAEMARQLIFAQYGNEAYTRGLNVYTTSNAGEQEVAYKALRQGIMNYERRQHYRGPEKFATLPGNPQELEETIDDILADHPDNGDVLSAMVLEAGPRKIVAMRPNGDTIEITGEGLKPVQSGLSDKAPPNIKIRRGAVIRVVKSPKDTWEATQLPEVEGAFVAVDPRTGAIKALVGGFDFDKNKFNHVTQAWRQPGSSFKPFIYSAALEKGFTPATVINDAPLFFDAGVTGGKPWEPKNYDGKFDGPMTMRSALARSKNMVSIRVLQAVGLRNAQEWATKFGFDADRHPAYLTMALGAGSVNPMQLAVGYSVFANGGFRVNPWLISRVTDHKGRVLSEIQPPSAQDLERAIEPRNAFIMDSLLQEVARSGTAARAQATLKRPDLYGKTGTTNDSWDAWFAGFQPTITAVTWIGYDTPRNLGSRETGGGLSLPVWISFMEKALKGVPVMEPTVPPGVVNVGGEWFYEEYARNAGVASLGMESQGTGGLPSDGPAPEERSRILDLFRN